MNFVRERLELADGDFLDLDWLRGGNLRLAILCHGLEASSHAPYIKAMAAALNRRGWDVLAWNCRGCSGEPNRLLRFYHSGSSDDLGAVVDHALATHSAAQVDLIGFSLGGNMTLKYLGERAGNMVPRLHRAVAFSAPCDLASSSVKLASVDNWIYMERFMRDLRRKIREKAPRFPGQFDLQGLGKIRSFQQFDDRFTAPLHGFADAADYWAQASSKPLLEQIEIPTLLVNAVNDPFLGLGCYPYAEAHRSLTFFLEAPSQGGHVGFPGCDSAGENWSERRAVEFLSADLPMN